MNDQFNYSQNKNSGRNPRRQSDYYPEDDRYPTDERYPSDDKYYYDDRYSEDDRYPRDNDYPEDDRYNDSYPYDYTYDDSYENDKYNEYEDDKYDTRYDNRRYESHTSKYDNDYYEEPRRESSRRETPSPSSRRRTNNDKQHRMNSNTESFRKRHPIIMHLIYACLATFLAIWIALWFLDYWTFHGQERAVPDVKGQSYEMALGNISRAGLRAIVTDSIYDNYARPGSVVDQTPIPLSKIKRGGTVYLTLVAYTPKMVTIPDFYDISERQARSMLEGLGITQIKTVQVPSEYEGLVLGTRYNGVTLRPGAKVPITAVITIEVGKGVTETTNDIIDETAIDEAIEALNTEE